MLSGLKLWKHFEHQRFGPYFASFGFCRQTPYFNSIYPKVSEMEAGYCKVSLKQEWMLQNGAGAIHPIAVCNLAEMAMGLVAETGIPANLRWIPKGMDVNHFMTPTGKITAVARVDPLTFFKLETYPGEVTIPVSVTNEDGDVVSHADIRLWISEKKPVK